jgi:alkylated DNA repair dioxygenase AlkB
VQLGLFGNGAPVIDSSFRVLERRALPNGAWVDYAPGWLDGHGVLYDHLVRTTRWQRGEEQMYDRIVQVPRLYAALPQHGPGHPILAEMKSALGARYGEDFCRLSLGYYRDGRDSVAWHGDRVARRMDSALVATVSVGAPRRFLMRPYGGGESIAYQLGWGDLLVMGGTCQRTYQHCVPKVARADGRIAVMFRPIWEE